MVVPASCGGSHLSAGLAELSLKMLFVPYFSCRIVFYSVFRQGDALDLAGSLHLSGTALGVEKELWLLQMSGINCGRQSAPSGRVIADCGSNSLVSCRSGIRWFFGVGNSS